MDVPCIGHPFKRIPKSIPWPGCGIPLPGRSPEIMGLYGVILRLYRGITGMMEKKMETTIMGLYRVWGLGFRYGL